MRFIFRGKAVGDASRELSKEADRGKPHKYSKT
jgi:hypothetical protein